MKRAVLLLANDLHIDKENIEDFVLNWDEMLEQATVNNVDRIVIGGDLFTNRSSQTLDVLMTVKTCIEKAGDHGMKLFIATLHVSLMLAISISLRS